MKALPASCAALALAALLSTGCTTPTTAQSNHWTIQSVGPRMTYTFFGYDGTKDGTGWEYTKRESGAVGKTLQRRLLGVNPDNPLTAND